tara:strand:+ start:791 stop:1039 length:249 start_codon:yes stop_codon:yes gene_type:complete
MEKDIINELEEMKTNLLSSVNKEGKYVTQIVHFKDGQRKTIHGIISSSIETGKFTKFNCKDGRMIMVNDDNVNMIETFKEEG